MWSQERTSPELLAPPSLLANGGGQSWTCCLGLLYIQQKSECSLGERHHSAYVHALKTLYILYTHTHIYMPYICLPSGSVVKNPPANAGDAGDMGSSPGSGRSPGKGHGNPLQYSSESHGQRSLVGYSPWGHKESDMTEQLSTHHVIYIHTIIT